MAGRRAALASAVVLLFLLPLASSTIMAEDGRGGFDADGNWSASVESDIHAYWWLYWSRDKDANQLDDRLEWLLEQPADVQQDWWRRAPAGSARVFVDYDHHPTDADVRVLERLGAEVTFRAKYLDLFAATVPFAALLDPKGVRALPGVVMVEDLGLAEPNMHEAVPTLGVDQVWTELGLDGTGSVIAILDTGIRGDHEGLNDMDDDPFTCLDDPPDPLDPNPDPIPADCDPKIIAFFDAVITDAEQDPAESYDSSDHGSHVAGIAAGTGGGQTDPSTGLRYIGAAPGAFLINILSCCDGDIEDILQGAQWAIDNKDRQWDGGHGIDILTSSLGEQQFEIHVDNDGNSAWSRQMDMVVEAGIITTLSAGNEFGGATLAGCNTIDSPGDARLPVTVASLDKDLSLAIYSSRGYTSDLRVKPDVATIGSNIMAPDAATKDGYTSKSGTSMATPLMAGIAALMMQANPDMTPTEFKDIIGAHSIEREIALLDDPGFNDCSLLESRPDNEFGYGQADPVAFVEAAGSIDRSLNVSMDVVTLQEIGNESYIAGTASGAAPGTGLVEVKVGGGEWQGAADLSKNGDWASWRIKLDPHEQSGNTTIYARLVMSDDSISPVDARRVILIDEMSAVGAAVGLVSIGSYVFFIPFVMILALLGYIMINERWDRKFLSALSSSDGEDEEFDIRAYSPARIPEVLRAGRRSWKEGNSLTESTMRRFVSLCVLYVAQGLPSGFTYVAFVAYLVDNGASPEQIAILFATIALPWTFKFIWGPMIDLIRFPAYGIRRPWILFAQTGMVVSLSTLLFVPDLNASIGLVTILLFVHNLFSSLQDVSVDALAVDVLEPHEVAKANGFMFAAKRGGIIFGGAVLGMLVVPFGIKSAIMVQLPVLLLIMLMPLFLRERPGDRLFPWSKPEEGQEDLWRTKEEESEEDPEAEIALPWDGDEDPRFNKARWVATNLYRDNVSLPAALLWVSIVALLIGGAFAILHLVSTNVTYGAIGGPFLLFTKVSFALTALLLIAEWLGVSLPDVPNPFFFMSRSSKRNVSSTAYYIVQGFSTRSSFLLIFLCLLAELYLFTDPIVVDIFINEASWSQTKYNVTMGGIVIAFMMLGQIIGGIIGDKFGVREVAMIGFTFLALANAGMALLSDYWTNTAVMTTYLCARSIVNGIAWICIIAVAMRLTFSKAGGTQFTAYMSMFNLSAVFAYLFAGEMIQRFDYTTSLYIGAALTLFTVILLWFIDPDEVDRVLEGRFGDGEDEFDGDFGERPEAWYEEDEAVVTST